MTKEDRSKLDYDGSDDFCPDKENLLWNGEPRRGHIAAFMDGKFITLGPVDPDKKMIWGGKEWRSEAGWTHKFVPSEEFHAKRGKAEEETG